MQILGIFSSNNRALGLAILAATLSLASCTEQDTTPQVVAQSEPSSQDTSTVLSSEQRDSAREIALDYIAQIPSGFEEVSLALSDMEEAVQGLLDEPTPSKLDSARESWLAAHSAYELTALHRYFAAQILDDGFDLELIQLQYRINHWPIIPGYVDYVEGYPDSGIVHDINVDLNRESLADQHGSFDLNEVTLGFHVLEFLLWGEALREDNRPATDYLVVSTLSENDLEVGFTLEQLSNNRRRQMLAIVATTLDQDFDALNLLWNEQAAVIREKVESLDEREIIVLLADSMVTLLSEELLLRSLYPMLNGDFTEGLQSPFSRSSQNAVSNQLSGLESLLLEHPSRTGTTLDLIFSALSDDFSEFFYQNFDASKSCLVLLYSDVDTAIESSTTEKEIEIVECINLLTNMVDHIERLKFDLLD